MLVAIRSSDGKRIPQQMRWGHVPWWSKDITLHDRMPVILVEEDWAKWLGEVPATTDELKALLIPFKDDALATWPVNRQKLCIMLCLMNGNPTLHSRPHLVVGYCENSHGAL
jgi:putative SOS response-associated peptidase YedK